MGSRSAGFTWGLSAAALIAFAANSLLCRGALGNGSIDAASFTGVRLISGALLLLVLGGGPKRGGSWISAAALFVYAAAFSYSYVRIGAAVGALVLFGAVQVSMVIGGLRAGERPGAVQWCGLALAFAGLVALTLPRLSAPDPFGVALMAVAGIAWGVYSLRGRNVTSPLAATSDNFLRSVPFAVVLLLVNLPRARLSMGGVTLAAISGGLASALGYSLWYAALPGLTRMRAAVMQLTVPVLAATGAMLLLGEVLTWQLTTAAAAILGGVALAIFRPTWNGAVRWWAREGR